MWALIVESGKFKGRKIRLAADRVIIGRSADAQIRVGSTDVSRHHCELLPTSQGVLVRDLESRNGTLVNGEVIAGEFLLAPGNTLTVGPMAFRLLPRAIPRKPATPADPSRLSDDDITSWLAGDVESMHSDTTVIPSGLVPPPPPEPESESEPPSPVTPAVPPPSKAKFDSVAEEAADIIRRHREMLAAMEAEQPD